MIVANLELCKELYAVSGWFDPSHKYNEIGEVVTWKPFTSKKHVPAYDLGYLLRKLPSMFNLYPDTVGEEFYMFTIQAGSTDEWAAVYGNVNNPYKCLSGFADTPEDAAAKLAIELFKQGILTK